MSVPPKNRPRAPRLVPFALGYEVGGLPARLLGVPFPSTDLFAEEDFSGVRWIACLAAAHPERTYAVRPWPIEFLERSVLSSPLSGETSACRAVARVAVQVRARLHAGEGVIAHCQMGAERTGAVIGTVLALEGFAPERTARVIADVLELQQPGWFGPRFPDDLAAAIRACAALAAADLP